VRALHPHPAAPTRAPRWGWAGGVTKPALPLALPLPLTYRPPMPFLVGCLALATPRFAIVLVVLFSDYIGRAYETTMWPLLGFFFMPLTTLSYAFAINSNGSVDGMYLVVVVVTVLLDLGLVGAGSRTRWKD